MVLHTIMFISLIWSGQVRPDATTWLRGPIQSDPDRSRLLSDDRLTLSTFSAVYHAAIGDVSGDILMPRWINLAAHFAWWAGKDQVNDRCAIKARLTLDETSGWFHCNIFAAIFGLESSWFRNETIVQYPPKSAAYPHKNNEQLLSCLTTILVDSLHLVLTGGREYSCHASHCSCCMWRLLWPSLQLDPSRKKNRTHPQNWKIYIHLSNMFDMQNFPIPWCHPNLETSDLQAFDCWDNAQQSPSHLPIVMSSFQRLELLESAGSTWWGLISTQFGAFDRHDRQWALYASR